MSRGLFLAVSGWTGATLGVAPSGYGSETWDYDDELGGDASAYDVAESIVDWANAAGRAWTGAVTFGWQTTDEAPYHGVAVYADASTAWTVSSELAAMLHWVPSATSTSISSSAGVDGSLRARIRLQHLVPWPAKIGGLGRSASWLADHVAHAPSSPSCSTVLEHTEHLALVEALETAASPRRGWIYHHATEAWVAVHLGQVRSRRLGPQLIGEDLEVLS